MLWLISTIAIVLVTGAVMQAIMPIKKPLTNAQLKAKGWQIED